MRSDSVSNVSERSSYTHSARAVLSDLAARLEVVIESVYASEVWRTLTDSRTPTATVTAIVREVMWSVRAYQPHTTEAGFAMLGRLPKSEAKLLMSLVHHKAEEAEHGEWAKRDFLLLGGEPSRLLDPVSPGTFAVASVWHRMAATENPFGYLGAEYLFECLTMRVAPEVVAVLKARGVPVERTGFVVEHAIEDVKHTNLIVHWILDVASRYPESAMAIRRCFDYFSAVYPGPVWAEALERATARETR